MISDRMRRLYQQLFANAVLSMSLILSGCGSQESTNTYPEVDHYDSIAPTTDPVFMRHQDPRIIETTVAEGISNTMPRVIDHMTWLDNEQKTRVSIALSNRSQSESESGLFSPVVTTTVPTATPTPPIINLDGNFKDWGIYVEGKPASTINNVSVPSLDGKALQCSITGATIPHSNVHCYQNLPSQPDADGFVLTLSFRFTPHSTCNNNGANSIPQAIEFSMSKWYQSKRYEFAVQWQNVGDGAPQWRYWNPAQHEPWVPISSGITQCLQGDQWHTIKLEGEILDEQVHYQTFSIDDQKYNLDLMVYAVFTPGEKDRLAVAVQLDGNASSSPYSVFIDKVNLFTRNSTSDAVTPGLSPVPTATPTFTPSPTQMPTLAPVVDCSAARITFPTAGQKVSSRFPVKWEPKSCAMIVQYYQNEMLIKDFGLLDYGTLIDISEPGPGLKEIKIWEPGSPVQANAIWVQVN